VTYPGAGNLGSGGFMIVRTPGGKSTAIDYRRKHREIDADDVGSDSAIVPALTASGYLARRAERCAVSRSRTNSAGWLAGCRAAGVNWPSAVSPAASRVA
jgi:hypothetical protein